jgi:hypothetical protein
MASGFFLLFRPSGESQSKRLNQEEHEEEQDEFFVLFVSTLPRPVQSGQLGRQNARRSSALRKEQEI